MSNLADLEEQAQHHRTNHAERRNPRPSDARDKIFNQQVNSRHTSQFNPGNNQSSMMS
jgi:hypothetical protein